MNIWSVLWTLLKHQGISRHSAEYSPMPFQILKFENTTKSGLSVDKSTATQSIHALPGLH